MLYYNRLRRFSIINENFTISHKLQKHPILTLWKASERRKIVTFIPFLATFGRLRSKSQTYRKQRATTYRRMNEVIILHQPNHNLKEPASIVIEWLLRRDCPMWCGSIQGNHRTTILVLLPCFQR